MPGEYPRRLGASPLRAKALFIMPKYVTTRNILMNVVTELFETYNLCLESPLFIVDDSHDTCERTICQPDNIFLFKTAELAPYSHSLRVFPPRLRVMSGNLLVFGF